MDEKSERFNNFLRYIVSRLNEQFSVGLDVEPSDLRGIGLGEMMDGISKMATALGLTGKRHEDLCRNVAVYAVYPIALEIDRKIKAYNWSKECSSCEHRQNCADNFFAPCQKVKADDDISAKDYYKHDDRRLVCDISELIELLDEDGLHNIKHCINDRLKEVD